MCIQATTGLMIVSALSSYGQYQAGKAQAKNAYDAQKRTNKLAKENTNPTKINSFPFFKVDLTPSIFIFI